MCFIIVSHSKSSHRYKKESVPTRISQVPRWREGQQDLSIITAVSEHGGASVGQPGSHFPFPHYGFSRPVLFSIGLDSPAPSLHPASRGLPTTSAPASPQLFTAAPHPTPTHTLGNPEQLLTCTQAQCLSGLGGDFPPSFTRT